MLDIDDHFCKFRVLMRGIDVLCIRWYRTSILSFLAPVSRHATLCIRLRAFHRDFHALPGKDLHDSLIIGVQLPENVSEEMAKGLIVYYYSLNRVSNISKVDLQ